MRVANHCTAVALVVASASVNAQEAIEPDDLGVVEAPVAGSTEVPLALVPRPVLHTARVAFKTFDTDAELTTAQLDVDDILAIWEVAGEVGGRALEADIKPDGTLEELEIQVDMEEVPQVVLDVQRRWFPTFQPEGEGLIEKSIRPSDGGLPQIWYEFSGVEFDVEVRSDGAAALVEPA